jgi:hypothetical protein
MASLTSFLPSLVPLLGMTQAAIYERQRALVRLGLLPKPSGRGRGSGAQATPRSAALICMSVMATDNLSEMDDRIAQLAGAKISTWRKSKRCGLTGAETFLDALDAIVGSPTLAERVLSVHVERQPLESSIHWKQPRSDNRDVSPFENKSRQYDYPIWVSARLDGSTLRKIAAALDGSHN